MSRRKFDWAESPGTAGDLQPLVEVVKFMEGAESRISQGLWPLKEVHDLVLNSIPGHVFDDIHAFIVPGMAVETFEWTPLRRETPLVVKCVSFNYVLGDAIDTYNVRLRFEQVPEPL